jgi:endonuclease III
MPSTSKFSWLVSALRKMHGNPQPPPARGVFELVAWEMVAYLADDEKRAAAFASLRKQIGVTPKAILAADVGELSAVLALGGIQPEHRANRLRLAAEIAIGEFDGKPDDILALPLPAARRALRKFPSVGEPGADKILLLAGSRPVFSLESNGLRVLLRVGYGRETKNYSATYRSVIDAVEAEAPEAAADFAGPYLLLRRHGQTICKTSAPRCGECLARERCNYFTERTNRSKAR